MENVYGESSEGENEMFLVVQTEAGSKAMVFSLRERRFT